MSKSLRDRGRNKGGGRGCEKGRNGYKTRGEGDMRKEEKDRRGKGEGGM